MINRRIFLHIAAANPLVAENANSLIFDFIVVPEFEDRLKSNQSLLAWAAGIPPKDLLQSFQVQQTEFVRAILKPVGPPFSGARFRESRSNRLEYRNLQVHHHARLLQEDAIDTLRLGRFPVFLVPEIHSKATIRGHARPIATLSGHRLGGYAVLTPQATPGTLSHELIAHVLLDGDPIHRPCPNDPSHSCDLNNIAAGGDRLTADSLQRRKALDVERLAPTQIRAIRQSLRTYAVPSPFRPNSFC